MNNIIIKTTAEEILGRTITTDEGIDISKIEEKESRADISLPTPLKEFYTILGNNTLFSDGFQHFAKIDELFVKDNKLVFLKEQQSVAYWAIDLNNNFSIFQTTHQDFTRDIEWYKMDFELAEFLLMILFFQCVMSDESYHKKARSGFEYTAFLNLKKHRKNKITQNFINTLNVAWKEITNKENIAIYWKKKQNEESIIMCFFSSENRELEMITACTKSKKFLDKLIDDYEFYQL